MSLGDLPGEPLDLRGVPGLAHVPVQLAQQLLYMGQASGPQLWHVPAYSGRAPPAFEGDAALAVAELHHVVDGAEGVEGDEGFVAAGQQPGHVLVLP